MNVPIPLFKPLHCIALHCTAPRRLSGPVCVEVLFALGIRGCLAERRKPNTDGRNQHIIATRCGDKQTSWPRDRPTRRDGLAVSQTIAVASALLRQATHSHCRAVTNKSKSIVHPRSLRSTAICRNCIQCSRNFSISPNILPWSISFTEFQEITTNRDRG